MERVLKILRFFSLSAVLFLFWILYTLDFHPQSLLLGASATTAVALVSYRIFFDQQGIKESRLVFRWDLIAVYLFFLILQNYIASFILIKQMITGTYASGVVRIKTRLSSRIGRTMLANTISLVPGTLTLWLEGSYLYVHWFDQKTRHRLKAGRMIKEPMESVLKKIFG